MDHGLQQFFVELDKDRARFSEILPPNDEAHALIDNLINFLFPVHCQHPRPSQVQFVLLRENDLIQLLEPLLKEKTVSVKVASAFFDALPAVHDALMDDAKAILQFDPAATCMEEVIATYPGFYAISAYRIAHELHKLNVPLLPRVFSEYIHGKTGIDIHPAATIGRSFFIDHGTGVVIGATCIIGDEVKLYQGVTLGAPASFKVAGKC